MRTGSLLSLGRRANGTNQHGYQHRCRKSLACHVSDYHEQSVVSSWQHLEEIASNLRGRLINRFDDVARKRLTLLWHNDLLDLARGSHLRLQQRLLCMYTDMAPALGHEDVHKPRISQANGNHDRRAIKPEPASHALCLGGIHLRLLRRVREPVAHRAHHHELHGEHQYGPHPPSRAQLHARHRVDNREEARKHNRERELERWLSPEIRDVAYEPHRGER